MCDVSHIVEKLKNTARSCKEGTNERRTGDRNKKQPRPKQAKRQRGPQKHAPATTASVCLCFAFYEPASSSSCLEPNKTQQDTVGLRLHVLSSTERNDLPAQPMVFLL